MKIIAGLSSMKNLRPNTSEAWPSAGLATNDASDETVVIIASLLAVRPTSLPSSSRKSEAWATATNRLWRVMANVAMTAIRTSCLVWCCCADSSASATASCTLVGDAGTGADSADGGPAAVAMVGCATFSLSGAMWASGTALAAGSAACGGDCGGELSPPAALSLAAGAAGCPGAGCSASALRSGERGWSAGGLRLRGCRTAPARVRGGI